MPIRFSSRDGNILLGAISGRPTCACCECPQPMLETIHRSASHDKCGFAEFGSPSSPPKIYLDYDATSDYGYSQHDYYDHDCTFHPSTPTEQPPIYYSCRYMLVRTVNSPTSLTETCVYIDDTGEHILATANTNISSEYTTSDLEAFTLSSLPAYVGEPAYHGGSDYSSRFLSIDEKAYAIAEVKYRFRFKAPNVGAGRYKLTWVERLVPTSGATTDTVKTWTWDGTLPSGYDPDNWSSWPVSSDFILAIPSINARLNIGPCIIASCTGVAPTDPCNP